MLGNAFLVFLAKKFTIVAEVRRFCCFVTNMLAASFRTRISKYSVSGSLICLVFYSIDSNNIMLGNAILVFLSKKLRYDCRRSTPSLLFCCKYVCRTRISKYSVSDSLIFSLIN